MEKDKKKLSSQIVSGLSKAMKIILLFIFSISLFLLIFFLIPNTCENDFKVYPEKGYCEFNLKTCEGLFGCKQYDNVQIPCGSEARLCGEKIVCDCSNNEDLIDRFSDYISFRDYGTDIHLSSDYPRLESWVENGQIECDETPLESNNSPLIRKRELNGKKYCIASSSEGAAGSIEKYYVYTTVIGDNIYVSKFLVHYSNCGNYPEEEIAKCHEERANFDLDTLVDQKIEKIIN